MPVLTWSVNTCPHPGFSTKRWTRPSPSVRTRPYSSGRLWRQSPKVAAAPRSLWNRSRAARSRSQTQSPLITRKSSWPRWLMQFFTLPAVPKGSSSTNQVSRTPSRSPPPK